MEVDWANASDKRFLVSRWLAPLDVKEVLLFVICGHDRCSNRISAILACSIFQDRLVHIYGAVVQLDWALWLAT